MGIVALLHLSMLGPILKRIESVQGGLDTAGSEDDVTVSCQLEVISRAILCNSKPRPLSQLGTPILADRKRQR